MKITFNGTGASEGFPALFCECEHCKKARGMDPINYRMRTSCLVDESLLIDFSSDTYARCLYGKLDLTKVDHLIVTHSHSDHFYPQDLCKVKPPYGHHNRKAPLQVYGNERVGRALENAFEDASEPDLDQYLRFNKLDVFKEYSIGDYKVTPLRGNHDDNELCFIYIIRRDNNTVLYGHDTGYFPEDTWDKLKEFKFNGVVLDCTTVGEKCPYSSHMGIHENVEVRQRMYEEGMADDQTTFIVTHFAHSGAPFYENVSKLASEYGFVAAYDGFTIEI